MAASRNGSSRNGSSRKSPPSMAPYQFAQFQVILAGAKGRYCSGMRLAQHPKHSKFPLLATEVWEKYYGMSQRPSNLNRSEWNRKCRQKLSEHLNERLGITIEPSQVRLKTIPDDVYAWERLSDKEHLFSKNISDHSISALKELYQEVGLSFEAVGNENSREHAAGSVAITGGGSFTSRIHELQNRLGEQTRELEQWQKRAELKEEMIRQAEIKTTELQRIIEEAQKDRERLGTDVQKWRLIAEQCQARTTKYDHAIRKVLAYLEEARPELDG